MASIEELEQQIEELRARLDAVAKGGELKMKSHGFRIGNLRIFQKEAAVGDDRLYQEEPDGAVTDLTAAGTGGAPANADFLVGTSNANLSAEIIVGTTPGGELGNTWASPTVDATHSGSAHHAEAHSVASHNDTTATGAETETLTDGSNADSLHLHGEVNIDSTPADDSATGIKTELTAGTNLVWGDFCYVGADGKMEKALATAEATSRVVAFCTETVNENATGTFLLQGFIRDDSAYDFTIGAKIYLSDDTAGAHDETQPAGTDETIVFLGIALTADVLYFNPSVQAIVQHV